MAPAGDSRKKTSIVATKVARAATRIKKPRRPPPSAASEQATQKYYKPHVALVRLMGTDGANAHLHCLNFGRTRQGSVSSGPATHDAQETGADPSPHACSPGMEMPDIQLKFRAVPLQRKKRGPRIRSTSPPALDDPSALPAFVPHVTTSVATHGPTTSSDHYLASSSGSALSGTSAMSHRITNYITQSRVPWTSQGADHSVPYLSASPCSGAGRMSGTHQPYLDYPDATSEHIDYWGAYTPSSSSRPTPTGWPRGYLVPCDFMSQSPDRPDIASVPRNIRPHQAVATHHTHIPIQVSYPSSQPPAYPLASAAAGTELEPRYLDSDGNRTALTAQFEIAIKPKFLSGRIAHDLADPHLAVPLAPTVGRRVYSQEHLSFAGSAQQDNSLLSAFAASFQEFGPVQLPAGVTGMAPYAAGPDPSVNHAPLEKAGPSAFGGEPVRSFYSVWSLDGDAQDTGMMVVLVYLVKSCSFYIDVSA